MCIHIDYQDCTNLFTKTIKADLKDNHLYTANKKETFYKTKNCQLNFSDINCFDEMKIKRSLYFGDM